MSTAAAIMQAGISAGAAQAIVGNVDAGVTATGSSSQADSYLVRAAVTEVTAGGATTGVRLPAANKGDTFIIGNHSGSNCLLYPPTGGALNGGSANAAETLGDTTTAIAVATSNVNFLVVLGA